MRNRIELFVIILFYCLPMKSSADYPADEMQRLNNLFSIKEQASKFESSGAVEDYWGLVYKATVITDYVLFRDQSDSNETLFVLKEDGLEALENGLNRVTLTPYERLLVAALIKRIRLVKPIQLTAVIPDESIGGLLRSRNPHNIEHPWLKPHPNLQYVSWYEWLHNQQQSENGQTLPISDNLIVPPSPLAPDKWIYSPSLLKSDKWIFAPYPVEQDKWKFNDNTMGYELPQNTSQP